MLLFSTSSTNADHKIKQPNHNNNVNENKTGKEMPLADENSATFSHALTKEMPSQTASETSQKYQNKSMFESDRNASFLEKIQEAILMQRLGVDLEKVKQLKEKIAELESMLETGDISQEDFQKQVLALEEMIAEEYQKGQERRQEKELKQANETQSTNDESLTS